jgi:hypothetical protein
MAQQRTRIDGVEPPGLSKRAAYGQ